MSSILWIVAALIGFVNLSSIVDIIWDSRIFAVQELIAKVIAFKDLYLKYKNSSNFRDNTT